MKFNVETSTRDGSLQKSTIEATHLDEAASQVSGQQPDMEWIDNAGTITGRLWKADGKGTEKIVVVQPHQITIK